MTDYKTAENIRAQGRERQTRFRDRNRKIELYFNRETQNDIIAYLTEQEKKPAEIVAERVKKQLTAE